MLITKVLGYSQNGVYVQVENSFAVMFVDYNTKTDECVEVGQDGIMGLDECNYELSVADRMYIEHYFETILEMEG